MMTVNAGRPAIDFATTCYHADLPFMFYGRHGVGKSSLLDVTASELGISCKVFDLSLMEPPDLVGLPWRRNGKTVYAPPESLPTSGKGGFLVFEELNRAAAYMRAPCLQLLTARRLNDYFLPKGWLPVAAINPPDDGYEVSELDSALLSRFVRALLVPDRDCWLEWARQEGLHKDVISYVETDTSIFDNPESNPRAWTYVSDLLSAPANAKAGRQTLRAAVSGLVGDERQASFFRFLKDGIRPLKAEEVLDDYPKHRDNVRAWAREEGKLDLVKDTLWSVKTMLQSEHLFNSVRHDKHRWRNLGRFLHDLPGDFCEEAESFFHEHGYPLPQMKKERQ